MQTSGLLNTTSHCKQTVDFAVICLRDLEQGANTALVMDGPALPTTRHIHSLDRRR